MSPRQDPPASEPEPAFSVVRGDPSDEELAALVVVLAVRRPVPVRPPAARSGWGEYWRALRTTPRPGPGAWQAAGRGW